MKQKLIILLQGQLIKLYQKRTDFLIKKVTCLDDNHLAIILRIYCLEKKLSKIQKAD